MALVAVGVSGGISAYKAVEVVRLLQKAGHEVAVVMTRAATRFVGPLTFEAITRRRVVTSQWTPGANADIEHIALASDAALFLVVPATANTIARLAHGLAGDFLTSLALATRAPVLLAPAMNTHMYDHPATQANLATLRSRGVHLVEPGEGYLACGWVGKGRLAEPDVIAAAALRLLAPSRALAGRRVLVTAGPTFEDLDPVRYLGNRSSGRMGMAVAAEAAARGADVTLVLGPTAVEPPGGMRVVRVRSAREMHAAVTEARDHADAIVMAAAVADYAPAGGPAGGKVKKQEGPLTVTLERTVDILADLGGWRAGRPHPVLVGFAAETSDVLAYAARKRESKQVDLIVANDVSQAGAGFEVDTNVASFVTASGTQSFPLEAKSVLAARIVDFIAARLAPAASDRMVPA
ncbi:peptidase ClpP [Luteitalea sp. TBR-22]|uniref:bifunctional phosphopantothenoylcysteine decarboxylase/phosphopantothenate--cysteine ligase CoaBC n=1 Tax=Luteitalea sp. TBR-22 TaxID=2802971 RepID=UPI001AF1CEB4|nr:bifunctional phosphopantothenoylcysteine decarboxylase/phosphopantothenate--cysteine ligase CoaBC [Luteitalea sp. TBR-22]BCS33687.1 peptidase ClpP [Luteitalea sp. TBR-22]